MPPAFFFLCFMLLIYSHTTSSRLQYTCQFIFRELMGAEFMITIDPEEFKNHSGVCINYSEKKIKEADCRIESTGLLFETGVKTQPVECFSIHNNKAFFKTENADYPFDIFSAVFYLVSRYEEYLPHAKDAYGRYAHENSIAFKEDFLKLPLINIWIKDFCLYLKNKYPASGFRLPVFSFLPTYDIDIAYSYKHKGFVRNAGGFIKSPSSERIKVLLGLQKDPFDCYNWLDSLHHEYKQVPLYFFLVPEKNGVYDKNILPLKDAMWKLIKKHAQAYEIGIHPSWQSNSHGSVLKKELQWLTEMSGKKFISISRQHYIKFSLPDTYRNLIEAGIHDEYSMGYGSTNGFRASVASSFNWYDLHKEEQTRLRIHPFCFMDANAYYEQKQTPAQTAGELEHYLNICREINGRLITIWHNNFLGTDRAFAGWKEIYRSFIQSVVSK